MAEQDQETRQDFQSQIPIRDFGSAVAAFGFGQDLGNNGNQIPGLEPTLAGIAVAGRCNDRLLGKPVDDQTEEGTDRGSKEK